MTKEECREMERQLIDFYKDHAENEIGGGARGGNLGDPLYTVEKNSCEP